MGGHIVIERARGDQPRKTILIADPDEATSMVVSGMLEAEGFETSTCGSASELIRAFVGKRPGMVLLEARLPDLDGIAVCRAIRQECEIPIVMLSAVHDENEATRALEAGADDFIRKPFGSAELVARVKAVLRRADALSGVQEIRLRAGPVCLDQAAHVVTIDDRDVPLSRIEFQLLGYLMANMNRVLTHDQILTRVWGSRYAGSAHVLRVTMSRLRQKLAIEGRDDVALQTLGGIGYRLQVSTARDQIAV
jgi:DNA-binding response OmpR family regulator